MKRSDTDIFRSMVIPHTEAMRLTCLRILGDEDEALDALQETLVSLWRHQESLSATENTRAYCCRSAHNISISRIRSRHSVNPIDSVNDPSDHSYETERIDGRDTLTRVRLLMNRLPDTQRRVLEMRSFDDMEINEIASNLSISESNVRQLLSRARRQLKTLCNSLL